MNRVNTSDHLHIGEHSSKNSSLSDHLKEVVDKLYEFRDQYFARTACTDREKKWEAVREQMNQTLIKLQSYQTIPGDSTSEVLSCFLFYLMGRTRNVMPEYDQVALEQLSHSVKLNPSSVEAWNELGECYWKAGNALSARNCFTCALEKNRNKVSLRNLSVVLRQLNIKDAEERKKFCFDGLQMAKEAVQLDPTDSESWLILGNSYLAVTFYSSHNSGCLKKALAAYRQAEKYEHTDRGFSSADLHYNKAAALIFDEKFQEGLENLEKCKLLDPGWDLPDKKIESTLQMLKCLNSMVVNKGKLKSRQLNAFLKSLSAKDWGSYQTSELKRIKIQDLKPGPNAGSFILCRVVASVPCEGGSPFACCVCDSDSSCIAVTLYRLAQGYGVTIGDSIVIPEPCLSTVSVNFNGQVISYPCVRIDSPQTILINGHTLRPNQMASMYMVSSTRHE